MGTLAAWLVMTALVSLASACGGSLYKVKPFVATSIPDGATGAEGGGVHLRASALLRDEEVQDLFEANLLLAGVLPVRIELSNNGAAPLDLEKVRLHLRESGEGGREWKSIKPGQAVARILDYYAVYAYNPQSKTKFQTDFKSYSLDVKTPLAPGDKRTGLVFFQSPRKESVSNPFGLVLSVEKLPQPLELRLN